MEQAHLHHEIDYEFPIYSLQYAPLLLDENVTFDQINELGFKTERKLLKNINLFDVYTGKNLPEGKKSYAVSFTLQDAQRTLTDKQIDRIMAKLQKSFEEQLGAELR